MGKRICSKCGINELRSTSGWCAKCINRHNREPGNNYERTAIAKRAVVMAYRERPCADCGRTWQDFGASSPLFMDLDHVPERGDKSFALGRSWRMSWDVLYRELAKCDTVDPNCHRLRTMFRLTTDADPS